MKILIVGLGLIGGSYASGLSKKNHTVYGVDVDQNSISYALEKGYICAGSTNAQDFIANADVIILGIYPQEIKNFIIAYNHLFKKEQVITDVCGVKSSFVADVTKICNATYISHHPMAGREKKGIAYANDEIFRGMNFLICPLDIEQTKAIDIIRRIGVDLGFGRITVLDITKHDQMIAFTSQLTHAIAISLVNSDNASDTINYIGDSYRDLTRIAMINEKLWSELFLENKENLFSKIESFEQELDKLKKCLKENDKEGLEKLFISSTGKRKEMEK